MDRSPTFDLARRIAVVTGGARGIGEAVCRRFANSGAVVAILDIDGHAAQRLQAEIAASGGASEAHSCDVADFERLQSVLDDLYRRHSAMDILVNNAAISHIGTAESTTEADFDEIYRVNVKGVFNGMKAVLPYMRQRGSGSIINLASVVSDQAVPERFAYSMSKGAVSAMTRSVAVDYLRDAIRCNCIAPARIHTPFVDGYLRRHYPGREAEMFEQLSRAQPVGRMGKPEEVAALVHYLASDAAGFITGATLPLDGGFLTLNP